MRQDDAAEKIGQTKDQTRGNTLLFFYREERHKKERGL